MLNKSDSAIYRCWLYCKDTVGKLYKGNEVKMIVALMYKITVMDLDEIIKRYRGW